MIPHDVVFITLGMTTVILLVLGFAFGVFGEDNKDEASMGIGCGFILASIIVVLATIIIFFITHYQYVDI